MLFIVGAGELVVTTVVVATVVVGVVVVDEAAVTGGALVVVASVLVDVDVDVVAEVGVPSVFSPQATPVHSTTTTANPLEKRRRALDGIDILPLLTTPELAPTLDVKALTANGFSSPAMPFRSTGSGASDRESLRQSRGR